MMDAEIIRSRIVAQMDLCDVKTKKELAKRVKVPYTTFMRYWNNPDEMPVGVLVRVTNFLNMRLIVE